MFDFMAMRRARVHSRRSESWRRADRRPTKRRAMTRVHCRCTQNRTHRDEKHVRVRHRETCRELAWMKENAKACTDHLIFKRGKRGEMRQKLCECVREFASLSMCDSEELDLRAIPVLVGKHARRQQTQRAGRRRRRRRRRVDLPRADRARLGADDDGRAVGGHARQSPRQAPVLASRRQMTAAIIVRGVDRAQRVARASRVEHAQTPVAAAGQQMQRMMRRLVR